MEKQNTGEYALLEIIYTTNPIKENNDDFIKKSIAGIEPNVFYYFINLGLKTNFDYLYSNQKSNLENTLKNANEKIKTTPNTLILIEEILFINYKSDLSYITNITRHEIKKQEVNFQPKTLLFFAGVSLMVLLILNFISATQEENLFEALTNRLGL